MRLISSTHAKHQLLVASQFNNLYQILVAFNVWMTALFYLFGIVLVSTCKYYSNFNIIFLPLKEVTSACGFNKRFYSTFLGIICKTLTTATVEVLFYDTRMTAHVAIHSHINVYDSLKTHLISFRAHSQQVLQEHIPCVLEAY